MIKQIVTISFGLLLSTSALTKNPFVPQFLLKKNPHTQVKTAPDANEDYVDLSGHWVGSCDNSSEEEMETDIEVDDDLSSITIDGATLPIDAISTQNSNENFLIEHNIGHVRWSPDGQQLLITSIGYLKEGSLAQGGLNSIQGNINYSINNDQLVIHYEVTSFADGIFQGTINYTCTLHNASELTQK